MTLHERTDLHEERDAYVQQWETASAECLSWLESNDRRQVLKVRNINAIHLEIQDLGSGHSPVAVSADLAFLPIPLKHLENLGIAFENAYSGKVSNQITWGLLRILIKIASTSPNAFHRFVSMIRNLGRKADLFNNFSKTNAGIDQLRECALEIQIQMISFFGRLIQRLRDIPFDLLDKTDDAVWRRPLEVYSRCISELDDIFNNFEKLAQILRSDIRMDQLSRMQSLLSLEPDMGREKANLPCFVLPPTTTTAIFDRDEIIKRIDSNFYGDADDDRKPRALTLYGLGGVGKSQTALKYAQKRMREGTVDAVLWAYSETPIALMQSFTSLALKLGLPEANEKQHEKNKTLFIDWLQRTRAKWLLIFDNAESSDLLTQYWPHSADGCVLITSRNHNLAFAPAGAGIEVPHFAREDGSGLILYLLSVDVGNDIQSEDTQSALELTDLLSGHALAISQIASLIHRKGWSIKEFLRVYSQNQRAINKRTSIGTVWKMSFESLKASPAALLGVLAFLTPDLTPEALFQPADRSVLPESLDFCENEFEFSEVVEDLLALALVRRDSKTGALSLHRLVQSQFRAYLTIHKRQEAFTAAAELLNAAFPARPQASHQMHRVWTTCALYLQHVISIMHVYDEDKDLKPTMAFCDLLIKCARYLCEISANKELEEMLIVAKKAMGDWPEAKNYPMMQVDLAFNNSVQWQQRGDFCLSDTFATESIRLNHEAECPEPMKSFVSLKLYNHKSNVQLCLRRPDEAFEWQSRIERLHLIPGAESVQPTTLTLGNKARCLLRLGRTDDALALYEAIIELTKKTPDDSFLNLAHALLGKANVYRQQQKYEEAMSYLWKARNTFVEHDAPTHEFVGVCYYKLGCAALVLNRVMEAIDHFRKSLTITEINAKYLSAQVARTRYKLGQALRRLPEYATEADEMSLQAEDLYAELKGDNLRIPPDGEAAFDFFVADIFR